MLNITKKNTAFLAAYVTLGVMLAVGTGLTQTQTALSAVLFLSVGLLLVDFYQYASA